VRLTFAIRFEVEGAEEPDRVDAEPAADPA